MLRRAYVRGHTTLCWVVECSRWNVAIRFRLQPMGNSCRRNPRREHVNDWFEIIASPRKWGVMILIYDRVAQWLRKTITIREKEFLQWCEIWWMVYHMYIRAFSVVQSNHVGWGSRSLGFFDEIRETKNHSQPKSCPRIEICFTSFHHFSPMPGDLSILSYLGKRKSLYTVGLSVFWKPIVHSPVPFLRTKWKIEASSSRSKNHSSFQHRNFCRVFRKGRPSKWIWTVWMIHT